jgi:hypothetical protein
MRISIISITLLMLTSFTACRTSREATYQPYKNGIGWSDADIHAEQFIVTYSAPPGTPYTLMRRMALIRAAEIAKARKSDYFRPTHWEIVQVDGAKTIILDETLSPLSLGDLTRKKDVPNDSALVLKGPQKRRIDFNLHIQLNPQDVSNALQTKTVLSEASAYRK